MVHTTPQNRKKTVGAGMKIYEDPLGFLVCIGIEVVTVFWSDP